jgi:hypothetical protein
LLALLDWGATKMAWRSYTWTLGLNLFYLVIIIYAFDRLNDRPEIITVAVLGLIYVSIRSIIIAQFTVSAEGFFSVTKQLLYIRKLLNDPHYEEEVARCQEYEADKNRRYNKLYIEGFFLIFIFLYCLVVVFKKL